MWGGRYKYKDGLEEEEPDDWLLTHIFHKPVQCEDKVCSWIIDGRISMNMGSLDWLTSYNC